MYWLYTVMCTCVLDDEDDTEIEEAFNVIAKSGEQAIALVKNELAKPHPPDEEFPKEWRYKDITVQEVGQQSSIDLCDPGIVDHQE